MSVDFPTPPLPDATARTRVAGESEIVRSAVCPPRRRDTSADFSSGVITSNPSLTRVTPGTSPTCRATCSWNESRNGQPATVSAMVTDTDPSSSTSTSRTMSSSVTGSAELRVDDVLERLQDRVAVGSHLSERTSGLLGVDRSTSAELSVEWGRGSMYRAGVRRGRDRSGHAVRRGEAACGGRFCFSA